MNTLEMIRRVRTAWQEVSGGYHKLTTTTGAGNAGGTTFVSTNITALDDFLNGKEVFIASGDALGQKRLIIDWVNSTNTGTLESTAGWQIASGVSIEIGEAGFFSDRDILDWLNDGQEDLKNKLTDAAVAVALENTSTLSLASGIATLPSDFSRPKDNYCIIDGDTAPIYPRNQYQKFVKTGWNTKRAYFQNKTLLYRPTTAAAVTLPYIQDIAEITEAANSNLDSDLHHAICDYAIHRGFLKNEAESHANRHLAEYDKKIESYNAQFQGRNL